MNTRFLSQTALVVSVLAGLAAAPAFAAEQVLVTHDEGNSGPALVQVQSHASSQVQSSQGVSGLVLHDEGNSGPELISAPASHQAHVAASDAAHAQLLVRDDGMTAPVIR